MQEAAKLTFENQTDLYMDTDIERMEVIVPNLLERAVGNELRISGLMRFPREKYDNYQGNPAENMKSTLDENWDKIFNELEDSRPGALGDDATLNSDISTSAYSHTNEIVTMTS